jgi:hypothetical protein
MYRSLGQLVEGWSKNLVIGGRQTLPPWLQPLAAPLSLAAGVGLWLAPPVLLLLALLGVGGSWLLAWSGVVCAMSVLIWSMFVREMGIPAFYGLLYPVGSAVGAYIFLRSWVRGRHIEWKGRRYTLSPRPWGA